MTGPTAGTGGLEVFGDVGHYNGAVLVRHPVIGTDELAEILTDAWRTAEPVALVRELDAGG